MARKNIYDFLVKDLQEKILLEQLVAERLGVLISQAGTLEDIYKNIRDEQREIKDMLKHIGPLVVNFRKIQRFIREQEGRRKRRSAK